MKDKFWIAAAFVLTFAAGVLVGAIVVRQFGPPPFAMLPFGDRSARHFPMHGEKPPLPSLGALQRQLDLNEAQQQQVAAIVEKFRERFEQNFRQFRPAMHEVITQMRLEIENVLTPEQLEKFRREFPRRERRGYGAKPAPRDSLPYERE